MQKNKPKLGQHFLIAHWAAEAVANAARIETNDTVLEIGPGKGILTEALLARAKKVIAIEKDSALITYLQERFSQEIANGTLVLLEGDIRDISPERLGLSAGRYILAANIPYYITGEIIRTFLTSPAHPKHMALLIQREVANRIARDEKESILSISVKVYGTPKRERVVPKRCFNPAPDVDSAVLSVTNISKDLFTDVDENLFFEIVRAGFASKRKTLVNNLMSVFGPKGKDVFAASGIPQKARAETLTIADWKRLTLIMESADGGEN